MLKKIGIIGAGGLIGNALQTYFRNKYSIFIIKSERLYGSPELLLPMLEGLDVIINLAGYPVAGRWNASIKKKIYNSRIITTRTLVSAINLLQVKPSLYINASAIGIYSDGESCDEDSKLFSDNFLAKLVKDWENEVSMARNVDTALLRIGVVLSRDGGAYALLRKIFNLGIGGKMGSGKQGFSFILIDDLVRIFEFVIENKLKGVINAVSPTPVNNGIFSNELAKVLHRPAFLIVPSIFIKLLYGEGSITILEGQIVVPKRLIELNFDFLGTNLETCLKILEK